MCVCVVSTMFDYYAVGGGAGDPALWQHALPNVLWISGRLGSGVPRNAVIVVTPMCPLV